MFTNGLGCDSSALYQWKKPPRLENQDFCLNTYDFCLVNQDFCRGTYDLCLRNYDFCLGNYDFCLEIYNFILGNCGFYLLIYDFCLRNFNFCLGTCDSYLVIYDFCLRNYDFCLKNLRFLGTTLSRAFPSRGNAGGPGSLLIRLMNLYRRVRNLQRQEEVRKMRTAVSARVMRSMMWRCLLKRWSV